MDIERERGRDRENRWEERRRDWSLSLSGRWLKPKGLCFLAFFFGCKVCALRNDVRKGSSLIYSIYTVVKVDGATPKRWRFVRGYDTPIHGELRHLLSRWYTHIKFGIYIGLFVATPEFIFQWLVILRPKGAKLKGCFFFSLHNALVMANRFGKWVDGSRVVFKVMLTATLSFA